MVLPGGDGNDCTCNGSSGGGSGSGDQKSKTLEEFHCFLLSLEPTLVDMIDMTHKRTANGNNNSDFFVWLAETKKTLYWLTFPSNDKYQSVFEETIVNNHGHMTYEDEQVFFQNKMTLNTKNEMDMFQEYLNDQQVALEERYAYAERLDRVRRAFYHMSMMIMTTFSSHTTSWCSSACNEPCVLYAYKHIEYVLFVQKQKQYRIHDFGIHVTEEELQIALTLFSLEKLKKLIETSKHARNHYVYWKLLYLVVKYLDWTLLHDTEMNNCRLMCHPSFCHVRASAKTDVREICEMEPHLESVYRLIQEKKFEMSMTLKPTTVGCSRFGTTLFKPTTFVDFSMLVGVPITIESVCKIMESGDLTKYKILETYFNMNPQRLCAYDTDYLVETYGKETYSKVIHAIWKYSKVVHEIWKVNHPAEIEKSLLFLLLQCNVLAYNRKCVQTPFCDLAIEPSVRKQLELYCKFMGMERPTKLFFVTSSSVVGWRDEWYSLYSLWQDWYGIGQIIRTLLQYCNRYSSSSSSLSLSRTNKTTDDGVMNNENEDDEQEEKEEEEEKSNCSGGSERISTNRRCEQDEKPLSSVVVVVLDCIVRRQLEVEMNMMMRACPPPGPFQCQTPVENNTRMWAQRMIKSTCWSLPSCLLNQEKGRR